MDGWVRHRRMGDEVCTFSWRKGAHFSAFTRLALNTRISLRVLSESAQMGYCEESKGTAEIAAWMQKFGGASSRRQMDELATALACHDTGGRIVYY